MYAIIRTGGKQAKVRQGDVIDVERLKAAGKEVEFAPLLVVDDDGNTISDRDQLAGYTVRAEIIGDTKGDKIDIFKYKNKTGYRRRMGHRQIYTTVKVTEIAVSKPKKAAKAKAAEAEEK
ncbi:MAG TPA: 50S ribosomal protein L21 [Acidimicrobiia bacterium]|nr:50S ribosomal protein L21 [Acidimicrobiia bacterium]